ncbi:MAG: GNAT family N-acetyltransferase [Clostridia bacterium]|nr:GNAT family N-acetyltransferase [Bacillota bacterium]MBQ7152639.1 GNAT family N-acetyltransferase [Clostridia bacterium]MBR0050586.1 GNAT family N-acetyltransferase [Bacillota bacterium]
MLKLVEINEQNWLDVRRLSVSKDQEGFLDSAVGILARGYVYRGQRARVLGIECDGEMIGVVLVKDLDEEPACYDLQQFMIDSRWQGKGYGMEALRLILAMVAEERKYDCVEVCVKRTDAAALRIYEKVGFEDTGYTDEDAPDCVNLMVHF